MAGKLRSKSRRKSRNKSRSKSRRKSRSKSRKGGRKSRKGGRKSRKGGRKSKKRRQRGGSGVAANAADFSPDNVVDTPDSGAPASGPPDSGPDSGPKDSGAKKQSGGKRKLNAYFKAMLHAKKNKSASFKYNSKTYNRVKRGHLFVYKKA